MHQGVGSALLLSILAVTAISLFVHRCSVSVESLRGVLFVMIHQGKHDRAGSS